MQQLKLNSNIFIYMIHDGTDVLSYVMFKSQCWLSYSSLVLIIDLEVVCCYISFILTHVLIKLLY